MKQHQPNWPNPTPKQLNSAEFEAVWNVIKRWDISAPEAGFGYESATGNHVAAILNALHLAGNKTRTVPIGDTYSMQWETGSVSVTPVRADGKNALVGRFCHFPSGNESNLLFSDNGTAAFLILASMAGKVAFGEDFHESEAKAKAQKFSVTQLLIDSERQLRSLLDNGPTCRDTVQNLADDLKHCVSYLKTT